MQIRHSERQESAIFYPATTWGRKTYVEFLGKTPTEEGHAITSAKADLASFLSLANALANRAGAVILPRFRSGLVATDKGSGVFDPVTEADAEAERVMRALIEQRCPDHGILGEEFGPKNIGADYCWILDPIDGTRAFIMGQPLWGTLIGLLESGRPMLGMMDQPFLGERFIGLGGEAHYHRGKTETQLKTRPCPSLGEALLASTGPDMFDAGDELPRFDALAEAVRLRRYGGDCYNYCLLAMGQIDLVVEAGLKPYDILPLIPIVEGAGGIVTAWDGGDPNQGGRIVAAGDRSLHEKALEYLSG